MHRHPGATLAVLALALAGCTGGPADLAGPTAPPTSAGVAAATRAPVSAGTTRAGASPAPASNPGALPAWDVGAEPLPLRPDGFGEIGPTPAVLRERALATTDHLAPPPRGRWQWSIQPIREPVRARMGRTWRPSCPVALADLRYLTVTFRGFDARAHTGELIVHRRVAREVVGVFETLFRAGFPIESMRLVTSADLDAAPTGDGNNTAAFVCRDTRKSDEWSAHAYGLAIDVNPFQNPYRNGDLVLPELASAYLDRTWERPGMIAKGGVVTRAFAAIGWTWGATFDSVTDTMHFSATGR